MGKIIDLDILRPEPRIIKLAGREIDVSFIPCGITFALDATLRELFALDQEKVKIEESEQKKAIGLTAQLCAIFCQIKHPEMDADWFMENASPTQMKMFGEAIQDTLTKIYQEIGEHSKN